MQQVGFFHIESLPWIQTLLWRQWEKRFCSPVCSPATVVLPPVLHHAGGCRKNFRHIKSLRAVAQQQPCARGNRPSQCESSPTTLRPSLRALLALPKVQKPCTAVCKQSVNDQNHHQKKKRATKWIARFPLLYWCRKEESNPRPSHYE